MVLVEGLIAMVSGLAILLGVGKHCHDEKRFRAQYPKQYSVKAKKGERVTLKRNKKEKIVIHSAYYGETDVTHMLAVMCASDMMEWEFLVSDMFLNWDAKAPDDTELHIKYELVLL